MTAGYDVRVLPAALKKLEIRGIAPVTADRMYFLFHLRSGDSQRPSTIALWTRGDKKPFPSVKLGHYAHAICVLPDGRLVAADERASILEGLTASKLDVPVIEDVSWTSAWVVEGDLVLGGTWGALQRRDASGAWTDLSTRFPKQIGAIAPHPQGGYVVGGADGYLAHVKAGEVVPVRHELGDVAIQAVHCGPDGTIVASSETKVLHGATVLDHPQPKKKFSELAGVGDQVFVSATDGLYRVHADKLERVACPVAPSSPFGGVSLRAVGDALVAFEGINAQMMVGGDWTPLT